MSSQFLDKQFPNFARLKNNQKTLSIYYEKH